MSADQSRSASPKRKPPQQQQQQRIGPIGVLSSPKFSFRAALDRHKASKITPTTSRSPEGSADTSVDVRISSQPPPQSQASSAARPIRSINTSSIPSLSAKGRFNSASTDCAFTSTLPRRKNADASPEVTRASSSLGKRPMDEGQSVDSSNSSSVMTDFGPVMRRNGPTANTSTGRIAAAASNRSHANTSRLPGPPSTRSQWNVAGASLKTAPSPSSAKAPHKVARPDGVAEVHAANAQTTTATSISPTSAHSESKNLRNRTISASARPKTQSQLPNKPKIGTLPRLKPKAAPVKTLLDERPLHRPRPSVFGPIVTNAKDDSDNDEVGDNDHSGESDSDDEDEDALEGPDVSRIRTKRLAIQRSDDTLALPKPDTTPTSMSPPATTTSASSRIASVGKTTGTRIASRPQRRSSSNSVALKAQEHEKENASHDFSASRRSSATQRPSMGSTLDTQLRARSSLPLAVSQPAPQAKSSNLPKDNTALDGNEQEAKNDALQPAGSIPVSPSKISSLSALRSRGLQTDSSKAVKPRTSTDGILPTRPSKQDLGIKASVIQANPAHPSILALQAVKASHHQPISTPEALIKAKKRLSGSLLSSSASSSSLSAIASTASPSERVSSLARSSSVKQGMYKKTQSTPRLGTKQLNSSEAGPVSTVTPSTSIPLLPRAGSRSPIKSSLLLFPTGARPDAPQTKQGDNASSPTRRHLTLVGTKDRIGIPSNTVLPSSEIDANLLASLKAVAQKANLKVEDLLHEERRERPQQLSESAIEAISSVTPEEAVKQRGRSQREASEELEALAGDVSVDLMAFDLAAGSPVSDVSVLRSPMTRGEVHPDTPPSVLATLAVPQPEAAQPPVDNVPAQQKAPGEEVSTTYEEDGSDTSCASPSVRAAAAIRLPRIPVVARDDKVAAETPVRHRGYRNVPSIPSTPFPIAGPGQTISPSKSARAYPPSAAMSAKTRTRLKKALRESLNLEAHFASIRLGSSNADDGLPEKLAAHQGARQMSRQADEGLLGGRRGKDAPGLRKSISAMLLTEDDRYLDELVSAVARIGLEDLAPDSAPSDLGADDMPETQAEPASSAEPVEANDPISEPAVTSSALHAQLSAALTELSTLREQLQLSQSHTSELQSQISAQAASTIRAARTQAILEADLVALKSEMAGLEWDKAKSSWARVRVEALAELEDVKVQKDAMLVLGSQLGVWERMIKAQV